jgi:hypothetical protein
VAGDAITARKTSCCCAISGSLYQEGYTIRGVQKLPLGGAAGAADNGVAAADTADAPSLFPLEPDRPGAAMPLSSRPARQSAARAGKPDLKAALEDIRRELLEARDLLAALGRQHRES